MPETVRHFKTKYQYVSTVKLHNRRVSMFKTDTGHVGLKYQTLIKISPGRIHDCSVKETQISLSEEAAAATRLLLQKYL